MDKSTMAPGVLVDSTNVIRTIWRLLWTNVASHHLIWKCWWVTEQTGDPRTSQQCKSSSHGISANWRPNMIYENLVRQPPATFSARSVTGCAVLILDLLHMSSPTWDDETRRIDFSVHTLHHIILDIFHSCMPSLCLLSRSWVKVKRHSQLCEGQPLCHSPLQCCLVILDIGIGIEYCNTFGKYC